jgi:hypothetical protein
MAFQNILGRLVDVMFGYDFFVSYTWADGSKYAYSLYEKLRAQGFTVFLDEKEYARGDNWTLLGRRALKKTRQLILTATPKVHESAPVLKELKAFQSTGRRIIPIEIGNSLDRQKYPKSRLLPLIPANSSKSNSRFNKTQFRTKLRPKSFANFVAVFKHVRQAQKRVRVLLGACLVAQRKGGARIVFTNKRSPAHTWREIAALAMAAKYPSTMSRCFRSARSYTRDPRSVFLCVGTSSACVANRVRGARGAHLRHDDSRLLRYDASSRTAGHDGGKGFCCCDSGSARLVV